MKSDNEQTSKAAYTRRTFLRTAVLGAGGMVVLAACGEGTVVATTLAGGAATPGTTVPGKEITLKYVTNLGEYSALYRQLFDGFEAENPGITVDLETFNEDTEGAYLARVAGGLIPAMEEIPENSGRLIDRTNYEQWVNLSETSFPWFDRWTYDVQNEWAVTYDLPGPRSLGPFQGIIASFVYHKDILDTVGWDPQNDVRTIDDLGRLLDDLEAMANDDPTLDVGWDRGWINGFMYLRYMNMVPVSYPDGSRERQTDAWLGRIAFNASDSPYRHTFEYTKEALTNGWNPEQWWNRSWQEDQETTFIGKKSAMLLHGPWVWDKSLAADPSLELLGFPFPSVDGNNTLLHQEAPATASGTAIRAGNESTDYWNETQELFNWFFSPQVLEARASIEGRGLLYETDQPLDLDGPQYQGLVKLLDEPVFAHVKLDNGPWGLERANPFQIQGSTGVWDVGGGSYNNVFIQAITGEITVQEALDVAQANWESSYEGLPT